MTIMEFVGCSLLAFGTPVAMFIITVSHDPISIIILMSSAFFWLVSLLVSSVLWFAVSPLRDVTSFGMVFSVLFQELFRYLLYKLLRLAETGLHKIAGDSKISQCPHSISYVSGLGFGLMSGVFALVNVLAASVGPATAGLRGHSSLFFGTSALLTLCMILLNTFWSVVFFHACDHSNCIWLALIVASHLAISSLTLVNTHQLYGVSCTGAVLLTIITGYWALVTAGGSCSSVARLRRIRLGGRHQQEPLSPPEHSPSLH